jgi:DNA polymerase I-like protein with 3'-5' exonuclease and polymerase domains
MKTLDRLLQSRGLKKRIVKTKEDLEAALADFRKAKYYSFDTETRGLDPRAPIAHVTSLGISTINYDWCFPLNHYKSPLFRKFNAQKRLVKKITKALENAKSVAHNGKFDYLHLRIHFGVKWKVHFDTMLAHYNLDENKRHGLKGLSEIYFNDPGYDIPLEEKWGITGSLDVHCDYLAKDCYYTLQLFFIFKKLLAEDKGTNDIFWNITMPVSHLYCEAEFRGVYINPEKIAFAKEFWGKIAKEQKEKMDELMPSMPLDFFIEKVKSTNGKKNKKGEVKFLSKDEIKEKALKLKKKDPNVNWGSPQQLAYILFNKLGLNPLKVTPAGAQSTDESVLLRLAKQHWLAKAIIDFREATKNLNTYIDAWQGKMYNQRIYPNFKIHGTVTGRPSCEEPNLQQVPRDPRLRSIITPPPGYILIDADYSQAELRIVAEMSRDPNLRLAYQTGIDVHGLTVERIFGILQKNQTKEERKKGKAVNFGFVYGMWWKKFIEYARDNYDTVFTPQEAENIRKEFFKLYGRLKFWHDSQKEFAKKVGFVRSIIGRKRRLPDAQKKDTGRYDYARDEALRQAINSPVQSFASDLNLMAAVEIQEQFDFEDLYVIGTIHDSILMYCKEELKEEACKTIKRIMEWPTLLTKLNIKMEVPLECEIEIGDWGAGQKWKAA